MRKLVVFLILLAVVLVILDRVAVTGVQKEIARQVEAKYDLASAPDVEVKGIPFLTQAISGHYQEIAISMGPITREGVRLASVNARLIGVNAQLNDLLASNANIVADRVTGTIVISRETVAARAPKGITVAGDGGDTLKVSGNVVMSNLKIPVSADMRLDVVPGGVRLTPENVKVGGGITVPVASRMIGWTVPVKNLPLNLKITQVRSTPVGLAIEGTATDVPLKG